MAFGSSNSAFLTTSNNTTYFSGVTHASFFSGTHYEIIAAQDATDLEVWLSTSVFDGGNESWSTTPKGLRSLTSENSPNQASLLAQGYHRHRIGIRSTDASVSSVTIHWTTD